LSCTLKVQTNVQLKNQISTKKKYQFSIGVQEKTPIFHRCTRKILFFIPFYANFVRNL